MRILMVGDFPNDPRLGSVKVPHKLQAEFREMGHQCDLLFADDLGSWPRHRVARWSAAPWLAARAIATAVREQGRYDVVDIAGGDGAVYGVLGRLGRHPGTAFVSRSNGLEHRNYGRLLDDHREGLVSKPWYRRVSYPATRLAQVAIAARTADRLLLLNDGDRAYVLDRGWTTPDEIDIVPHGLAPCFLDPPSGDEVRGAGALFCGSWSEVKGTPHLAAAWSRLAAAGQHVPLTVLGGGVPAETVKASFDPEARDDVTLIDRVCEAEVRAQYRRHDLLVFPSTYEGFGMVVPEAMSQGLPVVATPVGCVPDMVTDGESGLIVPTRDPGGLADAVSCLVGDATLRARLAAAGHARVRDLSWTRTARQTLSLYERAGVKASHGTGASGQGPVMRPPRVP